MAQPRINPEIRNARVPDPMPFDSATVPEYAAIIVANSIDMATGTADPKILIENVIQLR